MIQRLGQLHGIGVAQFAPLRHGGVQQRVRLVVESQAHVDRTDRVQQRGLDDRLPGKFGLNSRRALVEHFAGRDAVATSFTRVGDAKQVDEEVRGLARGLGLGFGAHRFAFVPGRAR